MVAVQAWYYYQSWVLWSQLDSCRYRCGRPHDELRTHLRSDHSFLLWSTKTTSYWDVWRQTHMDLKWVSYSGYGRSLFFCGYTCRKTMPVAVISPCMPLKENVGKASCPSTYIPAHCNMHFCALHSLHMTGFSHRARWIYNWSYQQGGGIHSPKSHVSMKHTAPNNRAAAGATASLRG